MSFGYNPYTSIYPVKIMTDQNMENVEYINYLASMRTSDARCTCEMKSRTATAKAAFNKKNSFHQQIGLKEQTSEVLHLEHSCVRC
jgi:hypothetical protein